MDAEPGATDLIRLTTDAVEARDRASLLGDVMARRLAGGHITVDVDQPVTCDWTLATLGPGTAIGFGRQGRFTATRDSAMLRDGDDDLSLFFLRRGPVAFEQNDRRVVLAPGQALVVAHGRPVRSDWVDSDLTILRLRRAALGGLGGPEAAGGTVLNPNSPAMRLLSAYLNALKPLALASAVPSLAVRQLGELARAAVAESMGATPGENKTGSGVLAARLAAMREIMLARYDDPALSMATISALTGISERTGYAVFEAAELSFSETIYAIRLDRAYERLRAGYSGALLNLALDVGFADQAHFNRRFRQRFGCTPGEVRQGGDGS